MIAILSPAKTLDFEKEVSAEYTLSRLPSQTRELVHTLQKKNSDDLKELMDISDNIADLNVERFQNFKERHTTTNAKQNIFAFKGDVYQGLDAESLSEDDLKYAQQHVRILSGLYGLLRPLDIIQPYRLEMGTQLKVNGSGNLYEYWDDAITKLLNKDLKDQGDDILVNLASNEYFRSIQKKKLKARIVEVEFKDFKNGEYKIISFWAKKARGMMARYIIQNRISTVEDLKGFDYDGYSCDHDSSTEDRLVFLRG